MNDFIHGDIHGTWDSIKSHPLINEIYPEFKQLSWEKTYFALNIQKLSHVQLPFDQYKRIVISFQTESFEHNSLWKLFNDNPDCEFLFLCDQAIEGIWPSNVKMLPWLTWAYQLNVGIQHFGIANSIDKPTKKISSLSARHEFHKAAITAFLIEKFDDSELVLSWHNNHVNEVYYLTEDYFIPEQIKKYLNGKFSSLQPIKLDQFENTPVANVNWHHPAYLESSINLTNETVYNSQAQIGERCVNLPTPYLTEKTWKPLLAGRPFIPVGQANTLKSLQQLGFCFDYNLDLSFDSCIEDFTRMIKIYQVLESLIELSSLEIYNQTYQSCEHNLNHIQSGKLKIICDQLNATTLEKVLQW